MSFTNIMSFLLASGLLAIMPGPDNIFVVTESVVKGKRNGILIALGLVSGVIFHTFLVASGVAIFIRDEPWLFQLIKYAGVLYLLYLVYMSYKEPVQSIQLDKAAANTNIPQEPAFKLYKKGVLMNVLNPKVTLFFIALLPQFLTQNGWKYELQIMVLGILFMLQALILFSGFAILADKLGGYLSSFGFWNKVKWIKIIVLLLIAGFLLLPE